MKPRKKKSDEELEKMTGKGMARKAAKSIRKRKQKNKQKLGDIMSTIRSGRKK